MLRPRSLMLPILLGVILPGCVAGGRGPGRGAEMEHVAVAPDGRGFVLVPSGRAFVPWGFNYDRDFRFRLLEDYWEDEWETVVADLAEMRALGATVVRIHLQFGRFMRAPNHRSETRGTGHRSETGATDPAALARLRRLLDACERLQLRADITGLGCYRKSDTPAWYDALDEAGRWAAQAAFWEAVAATCAASPAVFCYDLMNEPVVPGERRAAGDWLGPPFGGFCYVQFITLDPAGRPRAEIAAAWTRRMVAAIRRHDRRHLVTIGLVDWSLDRPGLTSGFVPAAVAPALDFLSVHIYPETGKVDEALATLAGFAAAKRPVVIEETFPLRCSLEEMRAFLHGSRVGSPSGGGVPGDASGWISFYWGRTPAECRAAGTLQDAITAEWVETFAAEGALFGAEQP